MIHIGNIGINLQAPGGVLTVQQLDFALELSSALNATRLVYHSGLQALDEVKNGVRATLLTAQELEEGARREVTAFRDLAHVAADAGDSHLHGKPRSPSLGTRAH